MKGITNKIIYALVLVSCILLTVFICLRVIESEVIVEMRGGREYFYKDGTVKEGADESIKEGVKDPSKIDTIKLDKININTAEKDELMEIPGVGDKTADKIIAYRKNKQFASIEEIMEVNGIGEGKFADMKDYIIVK